MTSAFTLTQSVRSLRSIPLRFPAVNGIVVAVHYKEGQLVSKGDPLVDIDSRPLIGADVETGSSEIRQVQFSSQHVQRVEIPRRLRRVAELL